MEKEDVVVDLRLRLDRATGKLEVSILSESEEDASSVALSSLLRMHVPDQKPLQDVAVKSAKSDPNSKKGARLRPMWTKTTCDIIK